MSDPRAEPSGENGNGNGNGHSHDGDGHDGSDGPDSLIRRIAVKEVQKLAVGRISAIESMLTGFRIVSGERYEHLRSDVSDVRSAVLSLQGDSADIKSAIHGVKLAVESLEGRVMLAFSDLGAKTGDMRGQLDSVHETDAEHGAALEALRKETKGTRALVVVRAGTLAAVAIAAWELAKWAAPLIDRITH